MIFYLFSIHCGIFNFCLRSNILNSSEYFCHFTVCYRKLSNIWRRRKKTI